MKVPREPAVAGLFYPGDADALGEAVDRMLASPAVRAGAAPKALVVPHAGYRYSGEVAASAYARLSPWAARYARVVLLGPCHRVPIRGLATSPADRFRTPLGSVPLDRDAIRDLEALGVRQAEAAHREEHSLEVQLPFLQRVLHDFRLVPVVVGDASPAAVERVIDALWDGDETLLVVSTDLSHYLPYDEARLVDAETRAAIESLDPEPLDHAHACGATPLAGLLRALRRRDLVTETLDLRNSGDTAGDRASVVGYGAWAAA